MHATNLIQLPIPEYRRHVLEAAYMDKIYDLDNADDIGDYHGIQRDTVLQDIQDLRGDLLS